MSLARLKAWLRANGLKPGDQGRATHAAQSLLCFLPPDRDGRSVAGADRRRRDRLDAAALDRGRSRDLVLRPAVLDRRELPWESDGGEPVPAPDGRPRHRIGDPRPGARRHLLRRRRAGGRARRGHPPSRRISLSCCRRGTSREGNGGESGLERGCGGSAKKRSRCGSRSPRASRERRGATLPALAAPPAPAADARAARRRAPGRRRRSAPARPAAAAGAARAPTETRPRARPRRRSTAPSTCTA